MLLNFKIKIVNKDSWLAVREHCKPGHTSEMVTHQTMVYFSLTAFRSDYECLRPLTYANVVFFLMTFIKQDIFNHQEFYYPI